jgi:peptide-methionine (R)-S-oxide reductase
MTQDRPSATRRTFIGLSLTAVAGALAWRMTGKDDAAAVAATPAPFKLTEAEWRKRLSPQAFAVLRQASTEAPFSSPLNDQHAKGIFACAGCALPLFASSTKFDSGTGWPSFYTHLPNAVGERTDRTLGMARTEVHCTRCAGHLGHVFDDGPQPTGLRYCMNGVAMRFTAA